MAKLEALFTKGKTGERDCAIASLEEIIDNLRILNKVFVSNPNKRVYNNTCLAEDAIYYTSRRVFIPETLAIRIAEENYLELVDFVQILNDSRYNHRRILPKNFYHILHISTPVEEKDLDCLVVDYRVLRTIAADLI